MLGISLKLNNHAFSKNAEVMQCCKGNCQVLFDLFKVPFELSHPPTEYSDWVSNLSKNAGNMDKFESLAIRFLRGLDDLTLLLVACIDTLPSYKYIADKVIQVSYALAVNGYALSVRNAQTLGDLQILLPKYMCTPTRNGACALSKFVHNSLSIMDTQSSTEIVSGNCDVEFTDIQMGELYSLTDEQCRFEDAKALQLFKSNCVQFLKAYGIKLTYNKIPKPEVCVDIFGMVRSWYRSSYRYYAGMSYAGYFTNYMFRNGHIDLQRMSTVIYCISCNNYSITATGILEGEYKKAGPDMSVMQCELYPPTISTKGLSMQDVWNRNLSFHRLSLPSAVSMHVKPNYFGPDKWEEIKTLLEPIVESLKYRIFDLQWGYKFIYLDSIQEEDLVQLTNAQMQYKDFDAQRLARANFDILSRQLHCGQNRYLPTYYETNITDKDLVAMINSSAPELYGDIMSVHFAEDWLWLLMLAWMFQFGSDIYSAEVMRRVSVVSYYLGCAGLYICEENKNYIDAESFDAYIDQFITPPNGPWYNAGSIAYDYHKAVRSGASKSERLQLLELLSEFSTGFFKETDSV